MHSSAVPDVSADGCRILPTQLYLLRPKKKGSRMLWTLGGVRIILPWITLPFMNVHCNRVEAGKWRAH